MAIMAIIMIADHFDRRSIGYSLKEGR